MLILTANTKGGISVVDEVLSSLSARQYSWVGRPLRWPNASCLCSLRQYASKCNPDRITVCALPPILVLVYYCSRSPLSILSRYICTVNGKGLNVSSVSFRSYHTYNQSCVFL